MLLAIDHGHHAIAFDRHGDGPAPPVVLLHGLSSARTTYVGVVEHLLHGPVASGRVQVVNVDLRGHGESSHAPTLDAYDASSYADDVIAVLEHVDAGAALLVGHSLGGVVATVVAQRRPDLAGRLLLEDPPMFEGDDERRAASPVASFFPLFVAAIRELQRRHAEVAEFADLLRATTPPEALDARVLGISRWDPATMEAAIAGVVWRAFDPAAPLACPVTVLCADPAAGAVFVAADAVRFRSGNPQAEIVVIEGATHSIHDPSTLPVYLQHLDREILAFARSPR
jgi:pimeloyl-ACP methyl ester carboxylesterase